jgi:hypothetical protein
VVVICNVVHIVACGASERSEATQGAQKYSEGCFFFWITPGSVASKDKTKMNIHVTQEILSLIMLALRQEHPAGLHHPSWQPVADRMAVG